MNKSAIVLGTAAVLLSLVTTQALAAKATIVKNVTVSYGDLNLKNDAGAKALYQRIRFAARKVCTLDNEPSFGLQSLERQQCIYQAIDVAVRKVNTPSVWAMYRASTNKAAG